MPIRVSTRRPRLFTPGPTEIPAEVYAALAEPLLPARSPAFTARLARVAAQLREVFLTDGDVVTLSASGTGALEAAFVNLVRRADHVLVAHAGKFGERWSELARAFGVSCREVTAPWGEPVTAPVLAAALAGAPRTDVVFLTHSETSTGIVHDVRALAQAVREHADALVVVDAVSSAGALPLRMDAWHIDACVAAAHKGLLCPPGLAFVAVGERARVRAAGADLPRFYFDLAPALAGVRDGGTPWTPAVSLVNALDCALGMLLANGLEQAWTRTATLAAATRAGVMAGGLAVFARPPGDSVSAVCTPRGLDARLLVRALRERGFEVAAGQDRIKREVFRIAHLGSIRDADLLDLMDALEDALDTLAPGLARSGAMRAAAAAVLTG